jgi:pseudouridine synthase
MASPIRLDKYLSHIGYATRAKVRVFLKENEVKINGKEIRDPSIKIDPKVDTLTINGEQLPFQAEHEYYILNKPKNVISTTEDELGRQTVVDFIETNKRVAPVGRLDKDTTGLVLLTNDGELTHMLIHPKYHVPKTYLLTIAGEVSNKQIKFFEKGVMLDDEKTLPAKAKIISCKNDQTLVEAILYEGRFQQIRRMCYALHLELIELKRIKFGPVELANLQEGDYRKLTEAEVIALKKATEKN